MNMDCRSEFSPTTTINRGICRAKARPAKVHYVAYLLHTIDLNK